MSTLDGIEGRPEIRTGSLDRSPLGSLDGCEITDADLLNNPAVSPLDLSAQLANIKVPDKKLVELANNMMVIFANSSTLSLPKEGLITLIVEGLEAANIVEKPGAVNAKKQSLDGQGLLMQYQYGGQLKTSLSPKGIVYLQRHFGLLAAEPGFDFFIPGDKSIEESRANASRTIERVNWEKMPYQKKLLVILTAANGSISEPYLLRVIGLHGVSNEEAEEIADMQKYMDSDIYKAGNSNYRDAPMLVRTTLNGFGKGRQLIRELSAPNQ